MSTAPKDDETRRRIAKNLERAMKASGITQADLSRMTGESESRISGYRRGIRLPSVSVAARIATALGIKVDNLIK